MTERMSHEIRAIWKFENFIQTPPDHASIHWFFPESNCCWWNWMRLMRSRLHRRRRHRGRQKIDLPFSGEAKRRVEEQSSRRLLFPLFSLPSFLSIIPISLARGRFTITIHSFLSWLRSLIRSFPTPPPLLIFFQKKLLPPHSPYIYSLISRRELPYMTFTRKGQKSPQRYRQTVKIADEEGRNIEKSKWN